MQEQLPSIWTLPPDAADFSTRCNLFKGHFSPALEKSAPISTSRVKRKERGLWQRQFWAHVIVDQDDFNNLLEYIHWNSIKHGYVKQVLDWPHSGFHQFVASGIYFATWGWAGKFNIDGGE